MAISPIINHKYFGYIILGPLNMYILDFGRYKSNQLHEKENVYD